MSDIRELIGVEIEKRLSPLFSSYPLNYFMRNPDETVIKTHMPCVLIMEGEDSIKSYSQRTYAGYPCKRDFEVFVEVWDLKDGDVRDLKKQSLALALGNASGVLLNNVTVREKKTIGPFNFGLPGVEGMRIILEISYKDNGPFET